MTPDTLPSLRFRRPPRPSRRYQVVLAVLLIAVVVTVGGFALDQLTRTSVTVDVNGSVRQFRTRAETVREVLDDAQVALDPEDAVQPDLDTRLSSGITITVRRAHVLALDVDDELRRVRTQMTHPLDILAEQRVHVSKYDVLRIDGRDYSVEHLEGQTWKQTPQAIQVLRSATVKVVDGERQLIVHTTQADVGRALDSAGVMLYLADAVSPDLSSPVYDGLVIEIARSVPVTVVADGRQLRTRALGPTVGDALAAIGLALIGQDYTQPPGTARLEPDTIIRLVRVTEKVIVEQEAIPFSTVYRPDPSLPETQERIVQEGTAGLRERQVRERYEDGQIVRRTVQHERVMQPPVPRLIVYGTRPQSYFPATASPTAFAVQLPFDNGTGP